MNARSPEASRRFPELFDFAAQCAEFLFKTFDVACHQKLGLIDPVIAADAAGEGAEQSVGFADVGGGPVGDLFKACDA